MEENNNKNEQERKKMIQNNFYGDGSNRGTGTVLLRCYSRKIEILAINIEGYTYF